MGTLASQAEISIWVQSPEALGRAEGGRSGVIPSAVGARVSPRKSLKLRMQNLA